MYALWYWQAICLQYKWHLGPTVIFPLLRESHKSYLWLPASHRLSFLKTKWTKLQWFPGQPCFPEKSQPGKLPKPFWAVNTKVRHKSCVKYLSVIFYWKNSAWYKCPSMPDSNTIRLIYPFTVGYIFWLWHILTLW